eukprot:COSAG05_NODE_11544_length_508_cov_1.122249_1_plen_91_part_01
MAHRSGSFKAGRTHHLDKKQYKSEPKTLHFRVPFEPPFPASLSAGGRGTQAELQPRVVTTSASKPGDAFPDVRSVVVHSVDAWGFNATVAR